MASDQQVTAKQILRALERIKRRGSMTLLEELETIEPDLAEYVMESLSHVHQQLLEQGVSARHTHRLYRQVRRLVMVAITSLRLAHYELWRDISPQPDDDNPDNRDDGDDDGDTSDPS